MKNKLTSIILDETEEIDIDQLIWEIDNSMSFKIFKIKNEDNSSTNILLKIKRK